MMYGSLFEPLPFVGTALSVPFQILFDKALAIIENPGVLKTVIKIREKTVNKDMNLLLILFFTEKTPFKVNYLKILKR